MGRPPPPPIRRWIRGSSSLEYGLGLAGPVLLVGAVVFLLEYAQLFPGWSWFTSSPSHMLVFNLGVLAPLFGGTAGTLAWLWPPPAPWLSPSPEGLAVLGGTVDRVVPWEKVQWTDGRRLKISDRWPTLVYSLTEAQASEIARVGRSAR